MKRSEINALIRHAMAFFARHNFHLPPFGSWTPNEWKRKGHEADEIRDKALGWDLTDFGGGEFETFGLLLFTLRNGDLAGQAGAKAYAEKIMIVREGQLTPWHFHWRKTEDIINRGGGNLMVEMAWATEDESGLDDRNVGVQLDGITYIVNAKGKMVLKPGESISLPPMLYHKFYGQEGRGDVLVGEVSTVNDDKTDNRFLDPLGRFPEIEEDEPPVRYLCSEYPVASSR